MGELLAIFWPSYPKLLREGLCRLFNEKIGCDIQIWLNEDSRFTQAHSFMFQIFCQIPQSSIFRFEDEAMCKDDVRCLMQFLYSGKTYVEAKRLKVVKRAAEKMGLNVFVDIIQEILNKREPNSNQGGTTERGQGQDSNNVESALGIQEENCAGSAVGEHNYSTNSRVENQEPVNAVRSNFGTVTEVSQENEAEVRLQKLKENSEIGDEEKSRCFRKKQQLLNKNCEIENEAILVNFTNSCSVVVPEENDGTESKRQKLDEDSQDGNTTALKKSSRKSKTAPIKKEFVCPVCDKVYRSKNHYEVHMKVHSNAEKVLQRCSYCSFKGLNLQVHLLWVHSRDIKGKILEKTLKCDQCDFATACQPQLNTHKLKKHTKPSVKCDQCPNTYHLNGELAKHKRLVHPDKDSSFMCDVCGASCKSATSLKLHKARHSAVKVPCDICGIQVLDYGLTKHKTEMHTNAQKRFKCGLCDAVCKQRMTLIFHFRSVHKVAQNEIKQMMRDKSTVVALDEVEKKPKEVGPVVCSVCGITLSQKSALYRHMKLHRENSTRRKCSFCKFMARDQDQLQVHLEKKHNNKKEKEEEQNVVEMNSAINMDELVLNDELSIDIFDQNSDSSSN